MPTSSVYPEWWTAHYQATAPFGHRLRVAFPERWFRIHSLPDSKRYAESDGERQELLRRQRAVASEVLRSTCRVITPRYEAASVGAMAKLEGFPDRSFECFASHRDDGDDDGFSDDVDVSFWIAVSEWSPTLEKGPLLAIADDALRALWMDTASGEVFAPYDGGVDVIASSTTRRDALKSKFSAWLSAHPEGL